MHTSAWKYCLALVLCVSPVFAAGPDDNGKPATYSSAAAAAYMDSRMTWWTTWPVSARDHGTFCVSCHTVLPYAMSRPALRKSLDETGPSGPEQKLLDNVKKRVRMWHEVEPFYPDAQRGVPKTAESRGTESILNALVLANYDAASGKMSDDTQLAFKNMWAEQLQGGEAKGAWSWLQFHNAPFEGDSQYYGAAMAAVAVGLTPANYRQSAEIEANMNCLRDYLKRERDTQTLLDRVVLVWASARISGLVTPEQRQAVLGEAISKQQPDGGFSLSGFVGNWKRHDNTPLETKSDGYATGLVTYVLQQAGMKRDDRPVREGLAWLKANQNATEGRWFSYSLNKQRDLATDVGKFMSDAATAYAVLSLEQ